MLLERLELLGFRSVPGELKLLLGNELTCLVGANEHGKSNLLDALNLMDAGEFGPHDRYVRSKDRTEPTLTFALVLSEYERRELLLAIKAEHAELVSPSDSTANSNTIALLEDVTEVTEVSKDLQISIELRSDSTRLLYIGDSDSGFPIFEKDGFAHLQKWLETHQPEVRLFAPSDNLVDSITLAELKAKTNLAFVGLLKLAGAWDEVDVLFGGDNAAHRHLQSAGRRLTRQVRRIWSQGSAHSFRFDETNGRLHVAIEDPTTFDMPSRRSLGFQSFLAFYLSVYAETDDVDPEGFILLFDEPGIHLHPRGQKDLLRELRKLSVKNQIVYTTHSPFMIDRNNPLNTVLVRKGMSGASKGTHVVAKPYGENWGALNRALGISAADGFFPADRVLLVEGRSDRLYVQFLMSLTQPFTRADLNDLSVVDSERRGEVEDYVRLLLARDRKIVVLADADQGGDDLAKRMRRIAGQKRAQLAFIDLRKLLSVSKDVSFEDALPPILWFNALQGYVSDVLGSEHQIDQSRLAILSQTRSLGRAAAEYLTEKKVIPSTRKFSKTTVADRFCRLGMPRPEPQSPLGQLCMEVTRQLNIEL